MMKKKTRKKKRDQKILEREGKVSRRGAKSTEEPQPVHLFNILFFFSCSGVLWVYFMLLSLIYISFSFSLVYLK